MKPLRWNNCCHRRRDREAERAAAGASVAMWLSFRMARRSQALAYGGLSKRAPQRAAALARDAYVSVQATPITASRVESK